MKFLIIYSTKDGQSQKISSKIAEYLIGQHTVQVVNFKDLNSEKLKDFDRILIGASIRYGHFAKELIRFIDNNHQLLEDNGSSFFGVNLIARNKEKATVENNVYVRKFLEKTSWKPKSVAIFAGKLDYPSYNFIDKNLIRLIMKITNGETNTSKSIEYTDWEAVKSFAEELSEH